MALTYPAAPRNVLVTPTQFINCIDICWDNPAVLVENEKFTILGHRVYRSDVGPDAEFHLISGPSLLVSRCFRDRTESRLIQKEDVTNRFLLKGQDPDRARYVFKVANIPIIVPNSQLHSTYNTVDVKVEVLDAVDGKLRKARVAAVRGDLGEVEIETRRFLDPITNRVADAVVPNLPAGDRVFATYTHGTRIVQVAFNHPHFYRVTTVARNQDGLLLETPLEHTRAVNNLQLDSNDFIWNRANVLNFWLLEQAGERVYFLLRKRSGTLCKCNDDKHGRARYDCPDCYGTQYVGGYEGPFETICSPFTGTRELVPTEAGLNTNMSYEVTILDPFLLNTGDIMIREDSTRFIVGAVTPSGARGTIRVQQAQVSRLAETDYLYRVPFHPHATHLSGPSERDNGFLEPDPQKPRAIDTKEPDRREIKGRTIPFGNLVQGGTIVSPNPPDVHPR